MREAARTSASSCGASSRRLLPSPVRRVRAVLIAVPNVSEGRDGSKIECLAEAFSSRARLLASNSDPDHHRSVFVLAAEPEPLAASLVAGVARARELIDLRLHDGVHPRVGATDVVPLVPLEPDGMAVAEE